MVSETDKPPVENDKDLDVGVVEAGAETTADTSGTAAEEARGNTDLAAADASSKEEVTEDAAVPEHAEDYNEIVGATTRTVHEDITRFLDTFERSARRWEMVVYPAMFAFIILAGYGFFLIYSLTNNMNTIASGFDPHMEQHMESLSSNMSSMTENIAMMTDEVHSMSQEIKAISGQMVYLSSMKPIADQMVQMEYSIQRMSGNLELMRHNMRDIYKPMSRINDFIPW